MRENQSLGTDAIPGILGFARTIPAFRNVSRVTVIRAAAHSAPGDLFSPVEAAHGFLISPENGTEKLPHAPQPVCHGNTKIRFFLRGVQRHLLRFLYSIGVIPRLFRNITIKGEACE